MWLLTAKTVAIIFGLATMAFGVSTIVLAIEKSNLKENLRDTLSKLDAISALTASSTTSSPLTTVKEPTLTSEVTAATLPSNSTELPRPTITVPNEPTFPTLPSGLPKPEKVIYHLPTNIRPIKYKLHIYPDLKLKTCTGSISIQIEIDVETNLIVLHAKDLIINSLSILNMMGRMRILIRKYYLDADREMFFIELDEVLYTMTPYVISISYDCQLDGLAGLYASSYLDADKKVRSIASDTKFFVQRVEYFANSLFSWRERKKEHKEVQTECRYEFYSI